MKCIALFLGAFVAPLLNYAQITQPDTLKLDIKNGQQIILIGKDLNSFNTIKTDSIIRRALLSVKDSLHNDKASAAKKQSKSELYTEVLKKKQIFRIESNIGAGLIKDKLSPFMGLDLNFAPHRQDYYLRYASGTYSFLNLAVNAFYLFDRDIAGNYQANTNIFLELSIGTRTNNREKYSSDVAEATMGVGYLLRNKGDYFERNTYKAFVSVIPNKSFIRLRPELYITDNFRKVFPGITISTGWLKEGG